VVTYLLDTAPFLWAVANPEKLSAKVRKLIDSRRNPLFVSVASLWEIIVKAQKGMLPIDDPPRWLDAGLVSLEALVLPIKPAHVYGVSQLPMIHKDPFDRLLLAQAASEGWVLISSDVVLRQYPVATIW
jgi:PIN domain nuclease of toxin-antitoxin system